MAHKIKPLAQNANLSLVKKLGFSRHRSLVWEKGQGPFGLLMTWDVRRGLQCTKGERFLLLIVSI